MSFDEPFLDQTPRDKIALVHGHDRVASDEDRDLVVVHHARTRRLERIENDEVMRVVLIDLRTLMAVLRILHGKGMKLQLLCYESKLLALRIRDVEPARMLAPKLGELIRGPVDDRVVLFHEETSRHLRSMRGDQAAKRRTTLTSSCASKGFARYASALQRSAS